MWEKEETKKERHKERKAKKDISTTMTFVLSFPILSYYLLSYNKITSRTSL